jgi:hypothetical protein
MYHMKGQEAIDMIEQLRQEVRWTKFELLQMVREHSAHLTGRMKRKRVRLHEMHLVDILAEVAQIGDGTPARDLFWKLVELAPFRIKLDNLDDREGCVMIEAESKILAVHDQSIAGSHWEAPDDLPIAYAMPGDHPGLLEELKKEGYEINEDEYCPPDPPEPEEASPCPVCGGPLEVMGKLGHLQHSRCRNCGMQTNEEVAS